MEIKLEDCTVHSWDNASPSPTYRVFVRVFHRPSNITVESGSHRSLLRARDDAFGKLRDRLRLLERDSSEEGKVHLREMMALKAKMVMDEGGQDHWNAMDLARFVTRYLESE